MKQKDMKYKEYENIGKPAALLGSLTAGCKSTK